MDIPRSQLGSKNVAITGKTEEEMETVFAKVSVVGHTLLLTMHRVFGGIKVNNQATRIFSSQ
jgi:hypothetical protein